MLFGESKKQTEQEDYINELIEDDEDDSVIDSSLVLEWTHTGFATSEWKTNNVILSTPGHYRIVIKNQNESFRTAFRLKGSDALSRSIFNYEDVFVSNKEKFKYDFVVGNAAVRLDLQAKLKIGSASYLGVKTKYLVEIFRYEKPAPQKERRQSFADPRWRRASMMKRKSSVKRLSTSMKDVELQLDDSADSNVVFTDNTFDEITDEEEYGSLRDAFTPRNHETSYLIKKY